MSLIFQVPEILNSFERITLPELDAYALMDRVDTKYVFPSDRIPSILEGLGRHYMALENDNLMVFPYHTTYYDSNDWFFFRQHVTQRGQRSKVRLRKYEQTGSTFLEVKNRNNKLRTKKWRLPKEIDKQGFDEESLKFIRLYIPCDTPQIGPVLVNRFKRITLASKAEEERVTIDFDLTFSDLEGNLVALPCIGIAERKRTDFTNRSPVAITLKRNRIYPTGFSKYCLGTSLIYHLPGKSHLKPKFLLINKIQYECI